MHIWKCLCGAAIFVPVNQNACNTGNAYVFFESHFINLLNFSIVAVIDLGILGALSGKAGPVAGANRKGINTPRAKPRRSKKDPTRQQA